MIRICLTVCGLLISIFGLFAQVKDSVGYRSRKLRLDEVHFVSSYYTQDGNNSAVTGGVGTERLTDYSNQFEFLLHSTNRKGRQLTWDAGLGVDYYTSASSDKINPYSISSASSRDLRIYPSITLKTADDSTGTSRQIGLSYSHESDYRSHGLNGGFGFKTADKQSDFSFKFQLYFDHVKIILPIELRTPATGGYPNAPNEYDYPWRRRHTYAGSISWSRIINQRLQVMAIMDITYQEGFLGLPFHRIYFKDYTLGTEKLPSSRLKFPIGFRAAYFLGDRFIIRPFVRYYADDWGLRSYQAECEAAIKLSPFLSLTPYYRFYRQTGIDYFAGFLQHETSEAYYSSNFDLSTFNSHFYGAGMRYNPVRGLLGNKRFASLDIRYGHYKRSNGLRADIISLGLTYRRT